MNYMPVAVCTSPYGKSAATNRAGNASTQVPTLVSARWRTPWGRLRQASKNLRPRRENGDLCAIGTGSDPAEPPAGPDERSDLGNRDPASCPCKALANSAGSNEPCVQSTMFLGRTVRGDFNIPMVVTRLTEGDVDGRIC